MTELTQRDKRRFDGNVDNWSYTEPPHKHSSRAVSARSLRAVDIDSLQQQIPNPYNTHTLAYISEDKQLTPTPQQHTPSNDDTADFSSIQPEAKTNCEKLNHMYQQIKKQMKDTIKDQWRRATQSGNDPYVKVTLKPAPRDRLAESFETKAIYGVGSRVAFDAIYDNGEYTFLCGTNTNALSHKYLKVEVLDVETGTTDRMIGTAHIVLKHFIQNINNTLYYAEIPLYGGVESNYEWSGTVEIHVTFQKIPMKQVGRMMQKNNKQFALGRFSNKLSKNSNENKVDGLPAIGRQRSETDQIMLARVGSVDETTKKKMEEEAMARVKQREEEKRKEKEETNARIIQGLIVNLILFVSLVVSGALFLGAMNIYEVDLQRTYFKDNWGTKYTMIDSFRYSIVTVTTIGYGDCFPQTTGGRIFGTFMIIFGVSLLARLLNSVLDRAAADYADSRLRRVTNRRAVTHDSMHEFDIDGDGVITSYEFLRTMLIRREDTTVETIDDIMELFDSYDQDGSGEIEVSEIKELIKQKQQEEMGILDHEEKGTGEMDSDERINVNVNGDMDEKDEDDDLEKDLAKLDNINKIDDRNEKKEYSYSDDKEDIYGIDYDYTNKAMKLNSDNYYHNVIDEFYWKLATADRKHDGNTQTFSDMMLVFMRKNGIADIQSFMEDEEYDTDALAQDIWDIYDENNYIAKDSNILHEIGNAQSMTNYVIDKLESFQYGLNIKIVGCDNLKESDSVEAAEDSFWLFIKGWVGFIAYLIVGAMIFSFVENANFGDMIWFALVTTCTVGYGDVRPVTTVGRVLNAFFIAVSVVLFVSVFSTTFDYIYARQEALVKQKASNKKTIANMVKKFPVLEEALKKREHEEEQNKNKNMNEKKDGNDAIEHVPSKVNGDIENGQQKNLSDIDENREAEYLKLNNKTVSELNPDDVNKAFEIDDT